MSEGKAPLIHRTTDFSEFITDLDHGKINYRLTQDLAKVIEAAEETGKQGSLIVKLNVKKQNGMAIVTVESSKKVPEEGMNGTLFYFGKEGTLLREDPRQTSFKDLPAPRIVGAGTDGGDQ